MTVNELIAKLSEIASEHGEKQVRIGMEEGGYTPDIRLDVYDNKRGEITVDIEEDSR